MKKSLSILLIGLLLFTLALTLVPATQSQPSTIKVLNHSYYIDQYGYYIVVGEVQNQGPNTINSTILTGVITGTDGTQIEGYTGLWGKYLLPNEKAPFYMSFDPSASEGSYLTEVSTVEIFVYSATPMSTQQYPNVAVKSSQSYIGTNPGKPATLNEPSDGDLGVFWVTGTIQNTGTQTAKGVTIYATFFNSNGTPVAVGYSATNATLDAGVTTNFKLGAFDRNQSVVPADQKIATYSLRVQTEGPFVEGQAPISVTPTPPPISSTTPAPTNNSGPNGTSNGLSNETLLYVGIAIAVIAAVIVAFILFKRRGHKVAHGSKYH